MDQLIGREKPRHDRLWMLGFAASLAASAAVVGAASLLVAYALRHGSPFCSGGICENARPYFDLIPFAALIRAAVVVRRRPWHDRRPPGYLEEINEAIVDASLGAGLLVIFTFFFRSGFEFQEFSFSRLVFVYDWLISLIGLSLLAIGTKYLLNRSRRRGRNQRRVLVVRDVEATPRVLRLIEDLAGLGYHVVTEIQIDTLRSDWLDSLKQQLVSYVREQGIDELLLLVNRIDARELSSLVGISELAHVDLRAVPELFGLPPAKVSLGQLGSIPVLDLLQEPLSPAGRVVKRFIDVLVSSALLLVTSPLLIAIAFAVNRSSAGPILVRQARIGMDGRPFEFLKFRTMVPAAGGDQHERYVSDLIKGTAEPTRHDQVLFKLQEDPRVTRVGRFLRRYSLDELPQLMNVLRGDMSLVGPRPSLPFEVAMYKEWHRRRLDVRPGITGLWQVSGRSKIGFDDMVRLDINYIERWSPVLDLLIVLRTVPALFRAETG